MSFLVRTIDTQGYAYETITVTSATVGQLSTKYLVPQQGIQPRKAVVSIEGDAIRYTYDGVTIATASVGHSLGSTGFIVLSGIQNIQNIRFSASSATATLQVTYER